LNAVREKNQHTKVNPSKSQQILRFESLKARGAWSEGFWTLNESNFNPMVLYPEKLSFKIDGAIKVFHNKQKLKQYMTTKPPLQKILQGILHTENESKQNHDKQAGPNYRRRKDNQSESNTNSAAHKPFNNKNN
jgi:hypothetical protein